MFIDSVNLTLSSGHGGAGAVSFRREKHVILGGPDGGDGGDGGDVYLIADNNSHTLAAYKGKRALKAQNGEAGSGRRMTGKKGENLDLIVPPGTAVYDAQTGELLADLTKEGERVLFLKGGKGGLGNVHFKSSINQAPEYAQKGLPEETRDVRFELKLIADVGLVGFPNVGKSTLISTISNAKPQIANYEFTTLTPKLGLVEVDEYSGFVMADIPGIIEGASDGRGLGLKFLKHIERTKILLYMLDLANYRGLEEQFFTLRGEVEKFSPELAKRDFAIALTRMDAAENLEQKVGEFLQILGLCGEQSKINGKALGKFDKNEQLNLGDKNEPCKMSADDANFGTDELCGAGSQECMQSNLTDDKFDVSLNLNGIGAGKFDEGNSGQANLTDKMGKNLIYKQDIYEFESSKPYFVMPISSATNQNIAELKFSLLELLKKEI